MKRAIVHVAVLLVSAYSCSAGMLYTPAWGVWSSEPTWQIWLRHATDPGIGYQVPLTKAGQVHAIAGIFEGVIRPAWYPPFTPDVTIGIGTGPDMSGSGGPPSAYHRIYGTGRSISYIAPAEVPSCDTVVVWYLQRAGTVGTAIISHVREGNATTIATINTSGPVTEVRHAQTFTLPDGITLVPGDQIRISSIPPDGNEVRIHGIICYASTGTPARGDQQLYMPTRTAVTYPQSSMEFAFEIGDDAMEAAGIHYEFVGGIVHQGGPGRVGRYGSETLDSEQWWRDGHEWTPAVGWTTGSMALERRTTATNVAASAALAELNYSYVVEADTLTFAVTGTALQTLHTGSMYPGMLPASASLSEFEYQPSGSRIVCLPVGTGPGCEPYGTCHEDPAYLTDRGVRAIGTPAGAALQWNWTWHSHPFSYMRIINYAPYYHKLYASLSISPSVINSGGTWGAGWEFSVGPGTPSVPPAGDVDGDGQVDVTDLLYLVDTFGSVKGDTSYDVRCDFNLDDWVDVVDLLILVTSFGT